MLKNVDIHKSTSANKQVLIFDYKIVLSEIFIIEICFTGYNLHLFTCGLVKKISSIFTNIFLVI